METEKPANVSDDERPHETDSTPDDGQGTSAPDYFMTEATALNTIAESFNPTLDRIRAMLKDIPKSGNQDIDARLRNIQTLLLQSRLPETANRLSSDIRNFEEDFSERMSGSYPNLTKSDLRMALYVRCGLCVQQISAISGMQPKSVNQARYRLRKALGLGQDDSLEAFIASF